MFECEGIRYLTAEDIEKINIDVIKNFTPHEPIGVRDEGLLQSVQQAPSTYCYYEQNDDIFMLAAVLFHAIAKGHVFANGNKRTAFQATLQFLLINGFDFDACWSEVVDAATALVTDTATREQLATWLECRSTALEEPHFMTYNSPESAD